MGAALHRLTPSRGAPVALQLAPYLAWTAFLVPVIAGVAGTLLPALGYLPALGGASFSLQPWRELMATPGLSRSIVVTLLVGNVATAVSFALAIGSCACLHRRRAAIRVAQGLGPILATPHSALALGLAFAITPSGWLVRWASPWLTGWSQPPDVAIVGDPLGIAMIAALVLKETPYLVLMTLAALNQVPAREHVIVARSMGYGRIDAWIKAVFPLVYPQLRLPLYTVLAFSLSVVDVALIVGPTEPPPLSVMALRGLADPQLRGWFGGAAAACLLLAIVVACIAGWRTVEFFAARLGRAWIARGARTTFVTPACVGALGASACGAVGAFVALAGMIVWSFAAQWRFPDALPARWTLDNWRRLGGDIAQLAGASASIAVAASVIALALTVACLEYEDRRPMRGPARYVAVLYLPLIVPQIAFLFGSQVLLVATGLDGSAIAVVWAHLIFVLPYVFLSLVRPWRALDPRYARAAASLGATPSRILWRIKVPLMLAPILMAFAVGFAVSVAQYLPTLFAGNGRVATLTTTAVSFAATGDRRIIGAYAALQALLPCAVYALAVLVPLRRQRIGAAFAWL